MSLKNRAPLSCVTCTGRQLALVSEPVPSLSHIQENKKPSDQKRNAGIIQIAATEKMLEQDQGPDPRRHLHALCPSLFIYEDLSPHSISSGMKTAPLIFSHSKKTPQNSSTVQPLPGSPSSSPLSPKFYPFKKILFFFFPRPV